MFGQNVTEHNPAPSPSGHPLLSGPPTLNDIHQIFTGKNVPWLGFHPPAARPEKGRNFANRMALLLLAMPSRAFTAEQPSATRWHELASYSFDDYKAEFGKAYATAEEEAHRRIDIDRWIVGQLCISRHTNHTLHGSAMLGPSQPRHKCTVDGDDPLSRCTAR